jgi:hypothetical protein
MIKLTNILHNILNEAKQVGTLYHFTSLDGLISIINRNCLKDRTASGQEKTFNPKSYYVSFTRNKNFNQVAKIFGLRTGINFNNVGCICRIQINGDKLSNKYSTEPVRDSVFFSKDTNSKWSQTPKIIKKGKKYYSADENEERIYTHQCVLINDYIEKITLIDPSDFCIEKIKNSLNYSGEIEIYNSKSKQTTLIK